MNFLDGGGERLTVLVVDDEALLRWSLAEVLRRSGHTVIEAASAAEALDAIGRRPGAIDAVMLDYRLPDSVNLRLLAQIRRQLPRAPVVLMTAFSAPEVVQGALDLGAYRVLGKPFDMLGIEGLIAQAYGAFRHH